MGRRHSDATIAMGNRDFLAVELMGGVDNDYLGYFEAGYVLWRLLSHKRGSE